MACNNDCHYDCSQPPPHLCPYPDITGIGVLVGYTATAGIVVLILVLHYHLAHDPTKDPFAKEDNSGSRNPRPNSVDIAYLSVPSRARAWLRPRQNVPKTKSYPRLEAVFTKCVQSMSDLQILTGISILISGYVQLRCGISAFHWQIITLLAWFSSITHLSCLTFLRNHLYNRPMERAWRLFAMSLMLLMLLVAMVPTGGYHWWSLYFDGRKPAVVHPKPQDYAICYLRPVVYRSVKEHPFGVTNDAFTFWTMLASALFLAFGFIYRVIRLHRVLSVSFVSVFRTFWSKKARNLLRRSYIKMGMQTSGLTLKRMFLYRPLLALFLAARVSLDLWTSMFMEILWVVVSFCWGIIRLLQTLRIEDRRPSDWSFGQVVPLVLLAAPLLTIFEAFSKAQRPANTLSTALVQFHTGYSEFDYDNTSLTTPLQARDHPDQDFYQNSSWTNSLISLTVAYSLGSATVFLLGGGLDNRPLIAYFVPPYPVTVPAFFMYFPVYTTLSILIFIMLSILLEDIGCVQENILRSFMGITRKRYILVCKVFLFGSSLAGSFVPWFARYTKMGLYCLCANAAIYCGLSAMVSYKTARLGDVFP